MNDIVEAESTVFPASRAANTEFGVLIRLTTVILGLDADRRAAVHQTAVASVTASHVSVATHPL